MTPRFSIVTPVYEPPLDVLQAAIDSVIDQTYQDWEFILVDDNSPSASVRELLRRAAAADSRITVIERATNGHIVASSNDGLKAVTGEFVVLLDHDDLMVPIALERVAHFIDEHPEADYLYSDEDKLGPQGTYIEPFHKPDWSPDRLRGQMYTGHLSTIRTAVIQQIGGFRPGFDGSQDHDLALRVSEVARQVVHIPEVLYHWRVLAGSAAGDAEAKPYAYEAGKRAIQSHLDRVGIKAEALMDLKIRGYFEIRRELLSSHRVSVVLASTGASGFVWGERRTFVVEAVRSLMATAGSVQSEVIVVHDSRTSDACLAELAELVGPSFVSCSVPDDSSLSYMYNAGALTARGNRLVLLHEDVQFQDEHWLPQLVAPLDQADVGMTAAKLFSSDQSVQNAGYQLVDGRYQPYLAGRAAHDPGPFSVLLLTRECSWVSSAALAIRPDVFESIGGMSPLLGGLAADIDLSNKIHAAGRRLLFVAGSKVFHFEYGSADLPPGVQQRATSRHWQELRRRWGAPIRDRFLPPDGR